MEPREPITGLARTTVLTVVTLVAFAGNSLLCRSALVEGAIDPVSFTALRLVSGALVLLPVLRTRRPWNLRAAAALFAYAIAFSLAYVSLETGTGALLLFGLVQVTMIGAGLRQGERPSPLRALGMAAAVLGVVLLVLPGVSAPDPLGAVLMAGAGVAWGVYSLSGRAVADPVAATACNFALAAPLGAGALLVAGVTGAHTIVVSGPGVWLALASGAITSGLGYVLWYAALRGHSATSAAVVQLAVPMIAALGGVALLGEEPTARLFGAGALTLGGVAVAVLAAQAPGAFGSMSPKALRFVGASGPRTPKEQVMILEKGTSVLVTHRRLFEQDHGRFFVGVVEEYDSGVARVCGHTWMRDGYRGEFRRKDDQRTKLIALASGTVLVYVLPSSARLGDLVIEREGVNTFVRDGHEVDMDVTEGVLRGGETPHVRAAS